MTSHLTLLARLLPGTRCIAIVAIICILSITRTTSVNATESQCKAWGAHGTMFPAVGRRTITLSDSDRNNRTLTVDIWYPAESNGESLTSYSPMLPSEGRYVALDDPIVATPSIDYGFPLLIFSHGYGGIRQQSAKFMEHLASWGFVVVSPDHAGNSRNDPAGTSIPFTILDRPRDVSFVIDSMMSPPFVNEFHLSSNADSDSTAVGVLGHSYGGLTSLLAAPDGHVSDDRVKAIMPIAPSVPVGFFPTNDGLSKINIPTLVLGGMNDTTTPVDPNNIVVFKNTSGLPRWNIVLSNAGHHNPAQTHMNH